MVLDACRSVSRPRNLVMLQKGVGVRFSVALCWLAMSVLPSAPGTAVPGSGRRPGTRAFRAATTLSVLPPLRGGGNQGGDGDFADGDGIAACFNALDGIAVAGNTNFLVAESADIRIIAGAGARDMTLAAKLALAASSARVKAAEKHGQPILDANDATNDAVPAAPNSAFDPTLDAQSPPAASATHARSTRGATVNGAQRGASLYAGVCIMRHRLHSSDATSSARKCVSVLCNSTCSYNTGTTIPVV